MHSEEILSFIRKSRRAKALKFNNLKGGLKECMSKIISSSTFRGSRHLTQTKRMQEKITQKLSSGNRINSASDDAAGLGISKKLTAATRSKRQAMRNANDAISIVQTIEGGLKDFALLVNRMRELAIQAASGTYNPDERMMMNMEFQQNMRQIDQLARKQEIFGQKIAVGNSRKLQIQVDIKKGSSNKIEIDLENLSHTTAALGINDADIASQRHAGFSLVKLDYAQKEISKSMARMGALTSRLNSAINKLQGDVVNTSAANSRIKDTDYAQTTAQNASNKIKQSGQTSVQAQTNNSFSNALKLIDN